MREDNAYKNLFIIDHPLVQHKLSHMRDTACDKVQFKTLLREISLLMGYEITRGLELVQTTITTPLEAMTGNILRARDPVIVPILRAGIGMSEGLEELMPASPVGYIGLYRDEETKEPVEYMVKLPELEERMVILVDPMLATGHTARYAVDVLKKSGARADSIRFMALVAAPEGVQEFQKSHSDIPVFVAALDERLNENAFIVPGLGDAGDRLFGTK